MDKILHYAQDLTVSTLISLHIGGFEKTDEALMFMGQSQGSCASVVPFSLLRRVLFSSDRAFTGSIKNEVLFLTTFDEPISQKRRKDMVVKRARGGMMWDDFENRVQYKYRPLESFKGSLKTNQQTGSLNGHSVDVQKRVFDVSKEFYVDMPDTDVADSQRPTDDALLSRSLIRSSCGKNGNSFDDPAYTRILAGEQSDTEVEEETDGVIALQNGRKDQDSILDLYASVQSDIMSATTRRRKKHKHGYRDGDHSVDEVNNEEDEKLNYLYSPVAMQGNDLGYHSTTERKCKMPGRDGPGMHSSVRPRSQGGLTPKGLTDDERDNSEYNGEGLVVVTQ